jgi:hypothetical protein
VTRTWSFDTEYGFVGGLEVPGRFVPVVACFVCVQTGERHAFWGRDGRLKDFIEDHRGDTFISHNLVAEAQYLWLSGITPPEPWFDTMFAYRYVTNAEYPPRYGLLAAAVDLKVPTHVTESEKEELREWIGLLQFDPDSPSDRRRIVEYCFGDCQVGVGLHQELVGRVPPPWMAFVTAYALAIAKSELRGVSFDVDTFSMIQERKDEILERVQSKVNATYRVFRDGQLDERALLLWCGARGIGWPKRWDKRTGRKRLSFDGKALKAMAGRHPFLEDVRQAKKMLVQLNDRDLAVDPVAGRHYFGNIPLAQKTGRTSLRGSIFSAPKGLWWLIRSPSPDHAIVVVDVKAEEFGVKGELSGDPAMIAAYRSGNPHWDLVIRTGAAPAGADKDDPKYEGLYDRYKAVNNGVLFGQTARGIAEITGMRLIEAQLLLAQHKEAFAISWAWSAGYVAEAFRRGRCFSKAGWPRKVGRLDNARSVVNHPIQSTAADVMRAAVINLTANGVFLVGVVHDSFVVECHRDDLARTREAIDDALGRAVQQVLPGALLRWQTDVYHDRYRVAKGEKTWRLISDTLEMGNHAPAVSLI